MKGVTRMTKKLAMLLTMLPLAALADVVVPPWDEVVQELDLCFWSVSAAVFAAVLIVAVCLAHWIEKHRLNKRRVHCVILKVIMGVLIGLAVPFFVAKFGVYGFKRIVIHHPAERPPKHCSSCGTGLKYQGGRYCPKCNPRAGDRDGNYDGGTGLAR